MSGAATAAPVAAMPAQTYTTLAEPVATPYTMPTMTTGPVTYMQSPVAYEPQQTTYGMPQASSTVAPAVTYSTPIQYATAPAPTYSMAAPITYEAAAPITYESPQIIQQTTYGQPAAYSVAAPTVTYEAAPVAAPTYTIAAPVTYEAPYAAPAYTMAAPMTYEAAPVMMAAPQMTTYGLPPVEVPVAAPVIMEAPAPVVMEAPAYTSVAPVTYTTAAPVTYTVGETVTAAPQIAPSFVQSPSMVAYQPQQGSYVISAPTVVTETAPVTVEPAKVTTTTTTPPAATKVTKKKSKGSKKKKACCC